MDKNFISVDDLVRQRFSGEEENERPAAWMQMRDLLDKEMPQRGGFLYWRRAFSIAGLLLLATSISVGGYLYATRGLNGNGNGANNNALAANTRTNNNLTASNTAVNNAPANNTTEIKETTASTTTSAAVNTNHNAKNTSNHKTTAGKVATDNIAANNTTTTPNTTTDNTTTSKTITDNTAKTAASNDISATNSNNTLAAATTPAKKATTGHTAAAKHQKAVETTISAAHATTADKAALAAAHKEAQSKEQARKADQKKEFLTKLIAANEAHKKAAAEMAKKNADKQLLASNKTGGKHTKAGAAITGSNDSKTVASGNNAKKHSAHHGAASTAVATTKPAGDAHTTTSDKAGQVSADKLALGSSTGNTSSAKSTSSVSADKAIDGNDKPVATTSGKRAGAKTSGSKQTPGSTSSNNPSAKNKPGTSGNGTQQGAVASNDKEEPASKREKVFFDQVIVNERYVSTRPTDGYYKADTISVEQLARELALNNGSSNNDRHSQSGAKKEKEEETSATENNNAVAANNAAIVPAASASATAQNGLGKQNKSSKGSGESTLEKLNATFNDVKYHVTGVQFAPGLTGGVNATFFGPNSFKGFQFGVTGNFSFGDNVAVMAEVKYFHRINNDYSLNDNYYTYTQAGNGQYSKQLQSNSYSFSTLHSIEMPITIRYTKSHFNFYAGGNFVYSFAINTGASQLPSTVTPVLVNAQGNDNTPKLHQDDFNSRFGLGYVLGLSYEVYPNLSLDFRNVQTVWDNAGSQGSKIVSGQLYRSPSFQVSIGYRLGGNKKKD